MDFEAVGTIEEQDNDEIVGNAHNYNTTTLTHPRPPRRCLDLGSSRWKTLSIATIMLVLLIVGMVYIGDRNNDVDTFSIGLRRTDTASRCYALFGLHEGYIDENPDGTTHTLANHLVSWMNGRQQRGEHALSGALRQETLVYPHDGTYVQVESAAVFAGVVSRSDEADPGRISDTLRNLTDDRCAPLKQEFMITNTAAANALGQ